MFITASSPQAEFAALRPHGLESELIPNGIQVIYSRQRSRRRDVFNSLTARIQRNGSLRDTLGDGLDNRAARS